MELRIIAPGRTKTAWLRQGEQQYLDRIARFLSISTTWVKAEPLREGNNESRVLAAEAARMEKCLLRDREYLVVLDPRGRSLTTGQLAGHFQQVMNQGTKAITFIIGGVVGVAPALRQQAHLLLSLSPLTLTHEMSRLVLLEQFYRVCTILKGGKYHK